MGFDPPSWQALCEGVRPRMLELDVFEPGLERGGWQHEASSRVEQQQKEDVSLKGWRPEIEHGCDHRVVLEAVWP